MSVGKVIFHKLVNNNTVTELIGTSVFPNTLPQDEDFPAVIYNRVNTTPNDTKSGASQVDRVDVQLDIYSKTYSQAITIATHIRTALDRFSGMVQGVNVDNIYFQTESDQGLIEDHNVFRIRQSYQFNIRL